jgi:hypothetical protein
MFISIIGLLAGFLFSRHLLIATVIALAIGFVFQTALFQILLRAKKETLSRWRAAILPLLGRMTSTPPTDVYEIRPRRDKRGVDLISDALPFGRLWYGEPDAIANAIDYAKSVSRSHIAVIRVYDDAGNVIETQEHAGDFKEP